MDNNSNEKCAERLETIGMTVHGVNLKYVCMGIDFVRSQLKMVDNVLINLEIKVNFIIKSLYEKEANK